MTDPQILTEAQSVRAGCWWWWGLYCIPGWRKTWTLMHGEYVSVHDARAMTASVVSRREAQRLNRDFAQSHAHLWSV